jgi:hypothetical protein
MVKSKGSEGESRQGREEDGREVIIREEEK